MNIRTDDRADDKGASPSRRTFLRGSAGLGGLAIAGAFGIPMTAHASTTLSDPATRKPILVGANPGLQLFDGGTLTAYAATWRVDWSPYGSGTALVLWRKNKVYVYGDNVRLARWLEHDFVRNFPEAEGLEWPEPIVRRQKVHVDIDLADGMRARTAGVDVQMSVVLDRRAFATDDFPLGGVDHSLSLVTAPCKLGSLAVNGRRVPGQPTLSGTPERPSSTAFLAEAEVWRR